MVNPIDPTSAAFLYAESRTQPMHVGGLQLFEKPEGAGRDYARQMYTQMSAPEEIALYPARAGTQARIQILFTAPFAEGVYESAWQAIDANGNPFGDPIYIRIAVQ